MENRHGAALVSPFIIMMKLKFRKSKKVEEATTEKVAPSKPKKKFKWSRLMPFSILDRYILSKHKREARCVFESTVVGNNQ
jgi:hypothetical protein